MALYIDRHFWLLLPVTIIVCCVFAARAAASLTEASVFDDAPRASGQRAAAPVATSEPRSKDGSALAARNMFCPTCDESQEPVTTPSRPAGDAIPITSLPVVLVATQLSGSPGASFASVINTSSRHAGAYAIGQSIPGIGKIEAIRRASVDFVNSTNNRLERVTLLEHAPPKPQQPVRKKPGASKAPSATGFAARLDEGVVKVSDNSYQIDRALFDEVTSNPTVIKGGRAMPLVRNGQVQGMRLYAVRPNSAFSKLGLRNGDVLKSVNGIELNSSDPDKLLEAYTRLRTASNLRLAVDRRGETVELSYSVR